MFGLLKIRRKTVQPELPSIVPPLLRAPPDAPVSVVATWHDRVLLSVPTGAAVTLDGGAACPVADLLGVNIVVEDTDPEAPRWITFHDGLTVINAPRRGARLPQVPTVHAVLNVAHRGRLDPVEVVYSDPEYGQVLPITGPRLRWSALVGARGAVITVRVELRDRAGNILVRSHGTASATAIGGQNPLNYARLGGHLTATDETVSARLFVHLAPLATSGMADAYFADVQFGATADPDRGLARTAVRLRPLNDRLSKGERQLMVVPFADAFRETTGTSVTLMVDGQAVPIGARPTLDGRGRLVTTNRAIIAEMGVVAGPGTLLADGRWIADLVNTPQEGHIRHDVPLPEQLGDGRAHRFELVVPAGRLALAFSVAEARSAWSPITDDMAPPLPGTFVPLAQHRYRALARWAERASMGREDPWIRQNLSHLHDALVGGISAEPFALDFPQEAEPVASIVVPAHDGERLTFLTLAALRFAPVAMPFEVIVVDDGSSDGLAGQLAAHENITVVRHETPRGFLRAANAGAAAARGSVIVHLNNDTEVTEGWLDALVAALNEPRAGIVGPKMIYPDGTLQDAGGCLDNDLNPIMTGRGGNAFDARYTYRREVDYVSGACLAICADLWRALGGFNDVFEPAYFEDTDLCFRAREAGRRVLYVPAATVVHSEGGSHGVDPAAGVKRQQALHAPMFKRLWAHRRPPALPHHLARDRGIAARILVALDAIPRCDQDAGSLAALEEIRLIWALGAKPTLLPADMTYLPHYADELMAEGVEVITAPSYASPAAFIRARGEEFNAVYVTRFQVLEALLPPLQRYAPSARIILNLADLAFLRELRASADDPLRAPSAEGIRQRELAAISMADVVATYSDTEAAVITAHLGADVKIAKVPFVQRLGPEPAHLAGRHGVAFLGNFRHPPNEEAVRWYAAEVAPRLGKDVAFTAYGSFSEAVLTAIDGICVGGRVANLRDAFDRHQVFVAPLRSGAGIKAKVFQALAAGLPVVATPVAVEGIAVEDGVHVIVADLAADFADAVRRLCTDTALWHSLSAAGRAFIGEHHGVRSGARMMQAVFEAADVFLPLDEDAVAALE